jgi:hypothetical protein
MTWRRWLQTGWQRPPTVFQSIDIEVWRQMRDMLGLSIGVSHLVAARADGTTVTRRSVLTLYADRAPEVGVPAENTNLTEPGLVFRGFLPASGKTGPLVACDGSVHQRDTLTAEALDAMARTVGCATTTIVAVPGCWGQNAIATLRAALHGKPSLETGGTPATLVSDATAALASLYAKPGFPTDGVIVLCDFGAGGTSVTLSDAASNFRHIGETVRYPNFAGDLLDRAVLRHLQAAFTAADYNLANTAPPGLLSRRLEACRLAKERLSAATVTVIPAEMPVIREEVRLSRLELEAIISDPLDEFIGSVEELLRQNAVPTARLAAIATVGGGACMPLVTERLEQRLHAPVVTTPQPILCAATGAVALAEEQLSADLPTEMAFRPDTSPGAGAPTAIEPSAWAAGAAVVAAAQSTEDGVESATYRALAWSEDDPASGEPLAYAQEDNSIDPALQPLVAPPPQPEPAPAPATTSQPRRKRLGMWLGLTAMATLVTLLVAGVMTSKLVSTHTPTPATSRLPVPRPLPSFGPLPPPSSSSPVIETSTRSAEPTVVAPTRVSTPVTTMTIAPTTTTPRSTTTTPSPTSSWPTSSQMTTPSSSPGTYPPYSPVTTTPTTAVLVPPRLVPVTPPYSP